jgi:hypothetical protein
MTFAPPRIAAASTSLSVHAVKTQDDGMSDLSSGRFCCTTISAAEDAKLLTSDDERLWKLKEQDRVKRRGFTGTT